jgi:hypothetical protein
MTRVLAKDKGYKFGMIFPENCKVDFMNLDMGEPVQGLLHEFNEEKVLNANGVDIRPYDAKIRDIEDFTLIDGEFQDEKYFKHRLNEIREWLKVEPLTIPDDVCVINFRGGEYVGVKDLFLTQAYWDEAMSMMPNKKFVVHTDDIETAQRFFPGIPCVHDVGLNWRAIRHARYLILSNSSFGILPALLGDAYKIIAPKYWARRNTGVWALPQNNYERFTYI